MENRTLYSIIIPVYGTSDSLTEISRRIDATFSSMDSKCYEIIFVNDGSKNTNTKHVLNEVFLSNSNVSVITFSKNFGQQAATLCGIRHAKGDYIITMDDDLQHIPESIPLLMSMQDHDVVIASFPDKKHSLFKKVTSNLKGWFDYIILKKPKAIKLSSFRLLSKNIAEGLDTSQTPYPFIPAMLFRITSDIVNVTINHNRRHEGSSQYTLWKMIRLFSNLIINNSFLLLRSLGIIGIGGFFMSLLFSLYLIVRHYFWGFGVSGWASLILAVVFLSGLILFGIGVIGEYLFRILTNLEQKNMYYIKDYQHH